MLLRIITGLAAFTPFGKPYESIESGNYGHPPSVWWWLKQSIIYFIGLFGMKVCVLVIFLTMPWIAKVGDWALGWTEGNEKIQIAFVMMIFPLIMNCLQYYIIDSFIKKKEHQHERLPSEDPDEHGRRYDDELSMSSEESEDDIDVEPAKLQDKTQTLRKDDEYDPEVDGDVPTVIGSTSSRKGIGKAVSPELFPKE